MLSRLTSERFNKHIHPFVPIFVSSRCEHLEITSKAENIDCEDAYVECVVQVEIVMAIEMAPDKFVNFGFARGVQVLELVNGLELDDIQSIGEDTVGFPLE